MTCMKRITIILLLAFSQVSLGQISRLRLTINSSYSDDSTCFRLFITTGVDTITDKIIYTDYYNEFDSLAPGQYKIRLFNCDNLLEPGIVRNTTLLPEQETNLHLDYSATENTYYFNPNKVKGEYKDRAEGQLNLSYINPNWIDKTSSLKSGATIALTGYKWFSFSNHFGLLAGMGLGYSYYEVSNDTTFMNLTSVKKNWEYYNYLHVNGDLKFRITLGSQKKHYHLKPRTVLDFGIIYYLPVVFRHIAWYDNDKKIVNKYLHQYTDLRTHVDFGISPIVFYAEYRLLDFIIKPYPEIPKYTFGIKVTIH